MSEPFHIRAAEIIAAYGGDPARWPDGERTTALHVIAASSELTTMLAEARALDADLAAWARAPFAVGTYAAAAAAAVTLRRPRPFGRWAMGTGLAASLAAGLLVFAPAHRLAPGIAPAAVATASGTTDDSAAFAQVFTPTPDEEQSL